MYNSTIQNYIAHKGHDVIVDIVTKGVDERIIKVDFSEPLVAVAAITTVAKEMGIHLGNWIMLLDLGMAYARIKEQ
jgi:hypothetical protein